jgi:hypothetical protein
MAPSIIYNMQYGLIRIGASATLIQTSIATCISGRVD